MPASCARTGCPIWIAGDFAKDIRNHFVYVAKMISVGSALSRAALGAFLRAAREMRATGTFNFADEAAPFAELNGMFR